MQYIFSESVTSEAPAVYGWHVGLAVEHADCCAVFDPGRGSDVREILWCDIDISGVVYPLLGSQNRCTNP